MYKFTNMINILYNITSAKHCSRRAENFQRTAYMIYELIKPFFLILISYVHNLRKCLYSAYAVH